MEEWSEEQRRQFGRRLKQARGKKPQVDVAAMFDIHKQSVSHWEVGRNLPSVERAAILAAEFNVSLDWLVGGGEQQWPFGDDIPHDAVSKLPPDLLGEARGMLKALLQQAAKRTPTSTEPNGTSGKPQRRAA